MFNQNTIEYNQLEILLPLKYNLPLLLLEILELQLQISVHNVELKLMEVPDSVQVVVLNYNNNILYFPSYFIVFIPQNENISSITIFVDKNDWVSHKNYLLFL